MAVGACLALGACSRAPNVPPPGPVDVRVIEVRPQTTEVYRELVGEVRGSQEVEIRSRVSGILLEKLFVDGSVVQKDNLLYRIDAREYRAQLANAEAQLASAQANLARAQQDVNRYEPLLAENAISQQVYDNAVAAAKQAAAQVEASRAAITEAKLGVEYADIRAPLSGRIGASQVFEGALIAAGDTKLAEISRDDPAWVYFGLSEAELLDYQRRYGTFELLDYQRRYGTAEPPENGPRRQVRLTLSDGSEYPEGGRINFADRALDATTGTFTLRAEFPNPAHQLVPGLFARIRITADVRNNALVVPDRAVQQQLGRYFVTAVGKDNKAEARPVQLGPRVGTHWIIEGGVKRGDKLVVEGLQKALPGTPLNPTVITEAELQTPAGPTPAAG
jgi:membrane fusion protein (multidrug efflux system)